MLGIKFVKKEIWLLRSPDINCIDYAIWSHLKRAVQGRFGIPNNDLAELRRRVIAQWCRVCTPV